MVYGNWKVLQVVLDIVVKKDALFLYQQIACILEENHFICTCASSVHLGHTWVQIKFTVISAGSSNKLSPSSLLGM